MRFTLNAILTFLCFIILIPVSHADSIHRKTVTVSIDSLMNNSNEGMMPHRNDELANPDPGEPTEKSSDASPMSRYEFMLSGFVLIFGLLILILETVLIKMGLLSAEHIIKFIVVTLIITGTLFLITAGYSNDQIAPATGLLGTIAGYLLGRSQSTPPDANTNSKA